MSRDRVLQHPDEYRDDLNPDWEAGENHGPHDYRSRSAYDIKELHQRYADLRNDELRALPVLDEGSRLAQGASYFDLRHPERGEFKAMGSMEAGPDNWYVPKSEVDYRLWNLITGVDNPDRLAELATQEAQDDRRRREEE